MGKAADVMLQAALECLVGQVDSALLITKKAMRVEGYRTIL